MIDNVLNELKLRLPAIIGREGQEGDKAGMFLCLKGTADLLCQGKIYNIQRGVLFFVSPMIQEYIVSQSNDYDGIYVLDDVTVFYDTVHSNVDTIKTLNILDYPCVKIEDSSISQFLEYTKRLDSKRELIRTASNSEEKAMLQNLAYLIEREMILEMLLAVLKKRSVEYHSIDRESAIVFNFLHGVLKRCKEHRTVSWYASQAGLSSGYFSAIVKKKTGRTPLEIITALTILQTQRLLESTSKSIKEIAAEMNFPEQFTFRKYFKQHTGMSPTEYRRSQAFRIK